MVQLLPPTAGTKLFKLLFACGILLTTFFTACEEKPDPKPLPPTITSIMPDSAFVNDTITINGTNFDTDPFNMSVLFSGVEAYNIVQATTTSLRVKVPKGATSGPVTVTIAEQTSPGVNFKILTIIPTTITGLSPKNGYYGDTVIITGTGIVPADFTAGTSTILFSGSAALDPKSILKLTATQLRAIVPNDAQTGPLSITLKNGAVIETDTFRLTPPLPTIASFTPASGPEGTPVTLTGANLGVSAANEITATLNGVNLNITDRSETQLKVVIPVGMKPGSYPFTITVRDKKVTTTTKFKVTEPPVANRYIYYGHGGEIRRASITEKDGKTTVANAPFFTDLTDVGDLVIDKVGKKIYWTESSANQIMVGNLDGTGKPKPVFKENSGAELNYPMGLAIANGKIYWANQGSYSIVRANLDGSSPEILFDAEKDGINFTQDVEMEITGNKLYWTDIGTYQIMRGNLDGKGQPEEVFGSADNLQYPMGLKLDAASGKLYVADSPSLGGIAPTDRVMVGNLNGTGNLSPVFKAGAGIEAVYAIDIDLKGGFIYWISNSINNGGSNNKLMRGKLDGSGKSEVIVDDLTNYGNALAVQVE